MFGILREAEFAAKRKAAYLALYPETANGRNQHEDRVGQVGQPTFADDQAAKTGPRPNCGQDGHNSFADDQAARTALNPLLTSVRLPSGA